MRTDISQGALRAVFENEQYWPLFNTVNRTNEGLKQLLLTTASPRKEFTILYKSSLG